MHIKFRYLIILFFNIKKLYRETKIKGSYIYIFYFLDGY